jgi:hypothetical protein
MTHFDWYRESQHEFQSDQCKKINIGLKTVKASQELLSVATVLPEITSTLYLLQWKIMFLNY